MGEGDGKGEVAFIDIPALGDGDAGKAAVEPEQQVTTSAAAEANNQRMSGQRICADERYWS